MYLYVLVGVCISMYLVECIRMYWYNISMYYAFVSRLRACSVLHDNLLRTIARLVGITK